MKGTRLAITWILLGAVVVGAAAWLVARGAPEPQTLSERVTAIAETLRCPVCRDLSVAESPSEIARQMRSSIAARLRAGESPAEIRAAFVRSYGQWILLSPPAQGLGWLVWLAPIAALALGGLLVVRAVRAMERRRDVTGGNDELSPTDRRELELALTDTLPEEDG